MKLGKWYGESGAIARYQHVRFEIEGRLRRDMFLNGEFTDALEMGMLIN